MTQRVQCVPWAAGDKAALFLHAPLAAHRPAGGMGLGGRTADNMRRSGPPPRTDHSTLRTEQTQARSEATSVTTGGTTAGAASSSTESGVDAGGSAGAVGVTTVEVNGGFGNIGSGAEAGGGGGGTNGSGGSGGSSSGGAATLGGVSCDYAAMVSAFVAKSGALLAALVIRPDGLHLRLSSRGGTAYTHPAPYTYACRADELPLDARQRSLSRHASAPSAGGSGGNASGGGGSGGANGSGGSGSGSVGSTGGSAGGNSANGGSANENGGGNGSTAAPWPTLFTTPSSAVPVLRSLWPAIAAVIDTRRALLRQYEAVFVASRPAAEPHGSEHCFWLLQIDDRALMVLAFAGNRGAKDAAVTAEPLPLATLAHSSVQMPSLQSGRLGVRR